ncbi:hypothetical protein ACTHQ8_02035 [Lysinibacillus odysseyi]|nr:hypothetical protein [Lysinibacillus odysseyi]
MEEGNTSFIFNLILSYKIFTVHFVNMKNLLNLIYVVASVYVLAVVVNWKEPEAFDYSIIGIYVIIIALAIFNITMYFRKKRT